MHVDYTDDMVLTRQQLVDLDRSSLLDYAEKSSTFLDQLLRSLEDKIVKLEESNTLLVNTNKLLKERADKTDLRIEAVEKELTRTSQYTLNRQLELHRVPESVGEQEVLQNAVCQALSLTGVQVTPDQLDKCHRLKKKTSVVIEFKQRVQRDPVLFARKNLKTKKDQLKELNMGGMIVNESL